MASSFSDITHALNSIQTTRAGVIAVYCISIYEWFDTFFAEVELIYPSRWNSIKVAYFLCRYYSLLLWPLVIIAYVANHSAQTCHQLTRLVSALFLPLQLLGPGVMLLRAYAFAGRHAKILALLLVFYMALIGVDIWFFCINVPSLPDSAYGALGDTGCFPNYTASHGATRLVIAIVASSVMDLVSLTVIGIYCLRTHSTRGSLGRLFIRQGLGAFAFASTVHCLALGTYFRPSTDHDGVGLPYTIIIDSLISCRIILDLRRKALPTETQILRRHSRIVDQALGFVNTDLWVIEEAE